MIRTFFLWFCFLFIKKSLDLYLFEGIHFLSCNRYFLDRGIQLLVSISLNYCHISSLLIWVFPHRTLYFTRLGLGILTDVCNRRNVGVPCLYGAECGAQHERVPLFDARPGAGRVSQCRPLLHSVQGTCIFFLCDHLFDTESGSRPLLNRVYLLPLLLTWMNYSVFTTIVPFL